MDHLNLQSIFPEIVLVFFAVVVLISGVFERHQKMAGALSLGGVFLSGFLMPASLSAGSASFSGMLVCDGFSVIFRAIFLMIAGMVILLSMGAGDLPEEDKPEYYFFLLIVTVAMMLAVAANNLMMIYIALETISIVSYIMAGFLKRDLFSSEAGMKYFLFGALSTGITLYGLSLVYGLFGALDLNLIAATLTAGSVDHFALWVALILVFAGLAFKCSLVPFHMWTPDVYQGAPTPVAAFFSVGPKAVGFVFFLRVFVENFQPAFLAWTPLAGTIAVLTMTVGNIVALKQDNIKRLLAYSTIAQAGYIFVGLALGAPAGINATVFYMFVYMFMNLGAFGSVIAVANTVKSDRIEDYAGMYKKDPTLTVILTVSLLSLAGIPPLAGFMAKFFILAAAVEAKFIILALAVVLNSVIALAYYVKVIKTMFLDEPKASAVVPLPGTIRLALTVTLIANLLIGIWPHPTIHWLTNLLHLV